jgi:hypothetical protein
MERLKIELLTIAATFLIILIITKHLVFTTGCCVFAILFYKYVGGDTALSPISKPKAKGASKFQRLSYLELVVEIVLKYH